MTDAVATEPISKETFAADARISQHAAEVSSDIAGETPVGTAEPTRDPETFSGP